MLQALPTPEALAQAAQAGGMSALAITDHVSLTGAVEFVHACQKTGIQPILGTEIILEMPSTAPIMLNLLVAEENGWSSLCHLITSIQSQPGERAGKCNLALLARLTPGLLAVAIGLEDTNEDHYFQLTDLFRDRLYIGVTKADGEDSPAFLRQLGLAKRLGAPAAAVQPVYALDPKQAPLLKTLAAIRTNEPLGKLSSSAYPPAHTARMLTEGEMRQWFGAYPETLAVTDEIAARCQGFSLPLNKPHYPIIPLPPGVDPAMVLRVRAEAGAKRLYGEVTPEIEKRLAHELKVISASGYEGIFLIMEEIIAYAQKTGVPVSSRGSAASSLVAHCLGITTPDPLRLNLYFERFLNPARSTPPDIDTDLCSRRRDSIIQHVFDTYGSDRVAMVGTINRFRPRSALGDTAKAHGLPPDRVRALVEAIPHRFFYQAPDATKVIQTTPVEVYTPKPSPFVELAAANPDPYLLEIFRQAEALLDLPRHLSVHAGGVIVSPISLSDLIPVQPSNKGVLITQMDLKSVEALGLVKIDLLGIRGLTVLGDVADALHSWKRKEYQSPLQILDTIPLEDQKVSNLIEEGRTIGCFQIESPGMRATLREIGARTPDDVMVALALYRPGPLKGGLKDAFVRRFKGEEPIQHIHPALAPLLDDTYGVILYQEQVLRIAHDLAGLNLAEADLLRRAMSHFDPGKQMQLLRQKFIAGAYLNHRIPQEIAEQIWEMMAAFAGYGFPKAHAASYSQVAWKSAWCKAHFPAEFMAAVLANWGGYYSQRVYLTEARRLGLKIKAPHINHSRTDFCVAYPEGEPVLFMGLDQVPELTHATQERILHGKPFNSLSEFLTKVNPRQIEVENLVRVGGLDGLGTIPGLLDRIRRNAWRPGQIALFEWGGSEEEDWSLQQRIAAQEALLGVTLDAHPLELFSQQIKEAGAITTVEAAGRIGEKVCVAGVRQSWHRGRMDSGETIVFLSLEDLEGMLDLVFFPAVYRRYQNVLDTEPILATGVIEIDEGRGEPILRVEKIEKLETREL